MSRTAVGRIAWKEFKQIRGIAAAFVVVALTCLALTSQFIEDNMWQRGHLALQTSAWFYLFSALCGAMLFAAEKENSTLSQIRLLPVQWQTVLSGKLFTGLAFIAVLPLIFLAVVGLFDTQKSSIAAAVSLLSGALQFFAIGLFCSLLCKRVLIAAVWAVVLSTTIDFLAIQSLSPALPDYFSFESYIWATPIRFLVAGFFLLVALPITRIWWQGISTETWRQRSVSTPTQELRQTHLRFRASRHLLWQSAHGNYGVLLCIATGFWLTAAMVAYFASPAGNIFLSIAVLAACWIAGVFCFQVDQRQNSFRFFVQHREHPRLLWLVRNAFWVGCLLLMVTVGLALSRIGAEGERASLPLMSYVIPWASNSFRYAIFYQLGFERLVEVIASYTPYLFCGGVLAYAVGQTSSMLFRSSIVSGFVSAVITVPLLIWTAMMMWMQVGWWWSVLPIAVALLFCTWWWSPRWMAERTTFLGNAVSVGVVVTVLAVFWLAVNFHRTGYVPDASIQWGWRADDVELIEQTRRKYATALASLDNTDNPDILQWSYEVERFGKPMGPAVSSKLTAWCEQNTAAISGLSEAAAFVADRWDHFENLKPWDYFDTRTIVEDGTPKQSSARNIPFDVFLLDRTPRQLLFAEAEIAINEGDHRRAWTAIESFLRISAQTDYFFPLFNRNRYFHTMPFQQVDRWANRGGYSEDELLHAISVIDALPDDPWERVRRRLFYHYQSAINDEGGWLPIQQAIWNSFPAERNNARNYVNQRVKSELDAIDTLRDRNLIRHFGTFEIGANRRLLISHNRVDQLATWEITTSAAFAFAYGEFSGVPTEGMIRTMIWYTRDERLKRAQMIKLALITYRLRHGNYPNTLDVLVEDRLLSELPNDPVTGAQFAYYPKGLPKPVLESAGHQPYYVQVAAADQPLLLTAPNANLIQKQVQVIDEKIDVSDEDFNPNELSPRVETGFIRGASTDRWTMNVMLLLLPEPEAH